MGEDRSTVHADNGPKIMAALRNTAISLLRHAGFSPIAARLRYNSGHPHAALQVLSLSLAWVYEKVVGKGKKKEYPVLQNPTKERAERNPSTWRRAKEWKTCCCKKPKPKCGNCCKACSRSRKEISRVWSSKSWQACSALDGDGWSRCSRPDRKSV